MGYTPISAVVITFNEEANIGRCLEALKEVADELVVVDSFSTDRTVAIAEAMGARVVLHKFEGHIGQKNYAASLASHDYVFSVDADELPDSRLAQQISRLRTNMDADGYTMNRLNNYCGKWIRHGAWYPDVKLRLWNRHKGNWTGLDPHDRYEMEAGSIIRHLSGDLLHYSYHTISEHEMKAEYFSSIAARAYFERGKFASRLHTVFSPLFRFVRDYLFRLGLLDGKEGLRIAMISASEVRMKYRKLRRLYRSAGNHERKDDKDD